MDIATGKWRFETRVFLLLDGLPSKADKPYLRRLLPNSAKIGNIGLQLLDLVFQENHQLTLKVFVPRHLIWQENKHATGVTSATDPALSISTDWSLD